MAAGMTFTMKDTVRTFIAVETSAAVRQRAAELIAIFAATGAKVSWVQPHNMHLTLKFLDEVPLNSIPQVSAAVQKAAAALEPFEVEIRGAGAFPSAGRPRTLWLGTGQGSEPLGKLHAALESALKPLGFPKEHRRFAAHLTIGRVRGPGPGLGELGPLIQQHSDFTAGQFPVAELVVFSSQLTPQGPIYDALSRATLRRMELIPLD
jgi:2'-5' RNA ligase